MINPVNYFVSININSFANPYKTAACHQTHPFCRYHQTCLFCPCHLSSCPFLGYDFDCFHFHFDYHSCFDYDVCHAFCVCLFSRLYASLHPYALPRFFLCHAFCLDYDCGCCFCYGCGACRDASWALFLIESKIKKMTLFSN